MDIADLEVEVVEDLDKKLFEETCLRLLLCSCLLRFLHEISQVILDKEELWMLQRVLISKSLNLLQAQHHHDVAEFDLNRCRSEFIPGDIDF